MKAIDLNPNTYTAKRGTIFTKMGGGFWHIQSGTGKFLGSLKTWGNTLTFAKVGRKVRQFNTFDQAEEFFLS